MMAFPFGEVWVVLVIVLAIALGAAAIGIAWAFEVRRARLPDATRLDDLRERATSLEEKITVGKEELRRLDESIHDRDRLAAEVAALVERIEALRAEWSGLAGAEQQIDAMKQRAADAAGTFATEMGRLGEARTAREEMERGIQGAESQVLKAQREFDLIEERIKTGSARLDEVQASARILEAERAGIEHDIAGLQGIRQALIEAREEAIAMAGRRLGMQRELETTEERIRDGSARLGKVQASVETLEDEKGTIKHEIAGMQGIRQALIEAR